MPPARKQQAAEEGAKRDSPNESIERPPPEQGNQNIGERTRSLPSGFVENPQHFLREPVAETCRVQPEQKLVETTLHETLLDSATRRCNLASRSTVFKRTRSASRTRRPNSVSR